MLHLRVINKICKLTGKNTEKSLVKHPKNSQLTFSLEADWDYEDNAK